MTGPRAAFVRLREIGRTGRPSRSASGSGASERVDERVEKLEAALEAATRERESLEAERDTRDRPRRDSRRAGRTRDRGRPTGVGTIDALREERDRLKSELSAARDRLPESDRTISAAEARSGTNLFVRYESRAARRSKTPTTERSTATRSARTSGSSTTPASRRMGWPSTVARTRSS